jgi:myo-inositol 2-dehydrogenase/D-chiro-inositol 1-dehydrogenase
MINFALFGAGRIGSIHANNDARHTQTRMVALHDPFQANADRLAAELGCGLMDPKAIFASDNIDAVLICSATDTHAELIETAIAAGKHVFCEKPIDLSLQRVRQCIQRVSQSSCKIMIGFNRRFDPQFQALQQQVEAGGIGAVELLSIISKDPAPPPLEYIKVSGGLFRDMTIHDFDMARFLLSEEVVSVSAQASCQVDAAIGEAGDVDTAVITMTSVSGKLAQISNSRRASFGYDQRIEVHGSEGMLVAQNVNENTVLAYNQTGVSSARPVHFFLERYEAAYRAELDSFVRCLMGETIKLPTLDDGLQALMLAEAALLSLQQRRNVKLSELDS